VFRLLVAGGGTGGHLFPGLAVAEEFQRRDPQTQVLFVGTGRPVELEVLGRYGLPSRTITALGLKGKSLIERLRSLAAVPVGLFQSARIIRDFRPDLVFGVGGYVSGPVGLAARMLGCPTAIHEQNSVPGLTNRLLGRLVDLVFISFESARRFFPADKTHLTGNPVRREIADLAGAAAAKKDGRFVLLVVGGSQGAQAVNQALVGAVDILRREDPPFRLIHQTGTKDLDQVKQAYEVMGLKAEVRPFIQDMGRAYLAADLVVARAGALTVAELAVMGRPAVFIPLPTAANNHQELNARFLAEAGAAEIIRQSELTPELLAEKIKALIRDRDRLKRMAAAAAKLARPEAAGAICRVCLNYLGRAG